MKNPFNSDGVGVVHDFQLTDDEFEATKDLLPDRYRTAARKSNINAVTGAFDKAIQIARRRNALQAEYIKEMEQDQRVAELEGDRSDVERLRRENEALAKENEDLRVITELRKAKNREIEERAQSAMAVHSQAGAH